MLSGILEALENSIFSEKSVNANGLLQKVDPRIKFFSFLLFILTAIIINSVILLSAILVMVIILTILSKISLKLFFLRTFLVPLFSMIIVLPLPFITPGSQLIVVGYSKYFISITWDGLYKAVQFTLRIWTCVTLLSLLVLTTRFYKFAFSMGKIKVPKMFISMIIVTYRFIFFFIDEAYHMILAKEARTVNKESRLLIMKSIAQIVSTLFIRAYEKGERVYLAMIARGYNGEIKTIDETVMNNKDWIFLMISLLIAFIILLINFWFRWYLW